MSIPPTYKTNTTNTMLWWRGLLVARRDEASWQQRTAVIVAMLLSLAYFYLVPAPLLALPGLLLFLLLAWSHLDVTLALLPVTFPFWFVPKQLFGDKVFPLSEIVLVVCLVVVLLQMGQQLLKKRHIYVNNIATIGRRDVQYWGPTTIIVVGIVLFAVGVSLGVVVARRRPEALRAWRWEILEPLIYLLLLLRYRRKKETLALLIWSFLGSALLVALLAAAQVLWFHVTFTPLGHGNHLVPYPDATGAVPRATAFIYGSSNSLGTWLARALPLALALALAPATHRWPRLAAALIMLACLPALFWSNSRGAWIAAALACLFVACVLLRRMRIAALLAAPVVAIVALWQRVALSNLLLAGHNSSGEVRTLVWLAAWHMIRDHLFFGIGPDQFLYYYSNLYTSHPYWIPKQNGHLTPAAYEPNLAQPHNLLLDLWLSGGLLALLGFLAVLAVFAYYCWHLWHRWHRWHRWRSWSSNRSAPPIAGMPVGPLALGLSGFMLAGLLHGMVDSAYFAPDLALAFWWAVAVVLLVRWFVDRQSAQSTSDHS